MAVRFFCTEPMADKADYDEIVDDYYCKWLPAGDNVALNAYLAEAGRRLATGVYVSLWLEIKGNGILVRFV